MAGKAKLGFFKFTAITAAVGQHIAESHLIPMLIAAASPESEGGTKVTIEEGTAAFKSLFQGDSFEALCHKCGAIIAS